MINGGKRVENSNEAVANAQVGDTVERNDGKVVTITQGDIDWAKEHTGTGGNEPSQATPATSESTPESQPSTPTNSSSTTGATSSANTSTPSSSYGSSGNNTSVNSGTSVPAFTDPFAPESNGNFEIDNKNKTVSADINKTQSVIDAFNSYYILSDRGYTFQLTDGNDVVQTMTNEKEAKEFVRLLDSSNENLSLSNTLGNISTISGVTNEILKKSIEYSEDASKIAKLGKYSSMTSRVSFYTGVLSTVIDFGKSLKDPTFKNHSKVFNGVTSLLNPYAGIASSLATDQIGKAAQVGIKVDANVIQKEYQINTFMNQTNSSPLLLKNMNLDTLFKAACNQGLAYYFEANY